ncbi:MAG: response regulator, partial [Gemmatimonadales bacterium]
MSRPRHCTVYPVCSGWRSRGRRLFPVESPLTSSTVPDPITRATIQVLLIEHDPAVARLVEESLEATAGAPYLLNLTANLAQGLEHLGRRRTDAVLLDLALPDAPGLDALRRVRVVAPQVPVVALTEREEDPLAFAALDQGAQDYLLKGRLGAPRLGRSIEYAVARARTARVSTQRESEAELQRITAGIPGAVYQYRIAPDGSGSFPFVSVGIMQLAGVTPEQLRADAALGWSLVVPEDGVGLPASLLESADTLRPWVREFRMRLPDGRLKWIRASAVPTREQDGGTLWNGVFVDVSEQRLLEEQLRHSQKLEAVGQLAGGIAHDFNNLLTAILSSTDMAARELPESHPVREYLSEIHRASDRAADLTRQLLAFSRRQVLRLEVLDLAEVVNEAERMLRRVIGEDVRLETRLTAGVPPVRADRGQLLQVLMNLAVNARDAMPSGGALTLATGHQIVDRTTATTHRGMTPGEYSVLAVSDTGTGMDEATQSRIFEPFFTTKPSGKGTGLGLSMVYGIVKQVEGYVQVDSQPAKGATFTIYLPAAPGATAVVRTPRRQRIRMHGDETVLVAEDEPGVRSPVRRILAAHGYRVLDAPTGMGALEAAEQHQGRIDLLLTDVVMPGMNGGELARRLRGVRPQCRVLYMSGYSTEAVATQGVLTPGAAFLQKPFSVEELVLRVREVLDSPLTDAPPAARRGDLDT